MDKITFIEIETPQGEKEIHAVIDKGNGEFHTMPKSTYDELKANEAEAI